MLHCIVFNYMALRAMCKYSILLTLFLPNIDDVNACIACMTAEFEVVIQQKAEHNEKLHQVEEVDVNTQTQTYTQIHTYTQIPASFQLPILFQPCVPSQPSTHPHRSQVPHPTTISAYPLVPDEALIINRRLVGISVDDNAMATLDPFRIFHTPVTRIWLYRKEYSPSSVFS